MMISNGEFQIFSKHFSSLFLHVIIMIYVSFCHCTRHSLIEGKASHTLYGYSLILCLAEARYIFAEKNE